MDSHNVESDDDMPILVDSEANTVISEILQNDPDFGFATFCAHFSQLRDVYVDRIINDPEVQREVGLAILEQGYQNSLRRQEMSNAEDSTVHTSSEESVAMKDILNSLFHPPRDNDAQQKK